MNTLQKVIAAAHKADESFERAVKLAGFKSRWDNGVANHPEVAAWYRAKISADSAMHDAFESDRLHAAGRTKAGNDISGI